MPLALDCTYDFEVAAAKYLHALRDGALPLQFLFSGTIFVKSDRGFSVQQVPWDCESRYDMPVSVWHDLIAQHLLGRALDPSEIAALIAWVCSEASSGVTGAVLPVDAGATAR